MHVEVSASASGNLKLIQILFILVYRKRLIHLMSQIRNFKECCPFYNLKDKLRYEVYETKFNIFLTGSKL